MRDWRREALLYARLPEHKHRVQAASLRVHDLLERSHSPYIGFSTGKDSICVSELVCEQHPQTPLVYFDADCAFPESSECLNRYAKHRKVIQWKCEPFFTTLHRMGGPTNPRCEAETMRSTVYRPVAELLKQYQFDGVFLGLRRQESAARSRLGALYYRKRDRIWNCNPIIDWRDRDVWAFIATRNLDYPAVYDRLRELCVPEHELRLSYWAGETYQAFGRWAVLKRGWPELFNRFAAEFPEVRAYV